MCRALIPQRSRNSCAPCLNNTRKRSNSCTRRARRCGENSAGKAFGQTGGSDHSSARLTECYYDSRNLAAKGWQSRRSGRSTRVRRSSWCDSSLHGTGARSKPHRLPAMRGLARRLSKLEETAAPKRSKRWVICFEGISPIGFVQPTAEEVEQAARVWVVRPVATQEHRLLEPGALPAYR